MTLFEYGNEVRCPCGRKVSLGSGHTIERQIPREHTTPPDRDCSPQDNERAPPDSEGAPPDREEGGSGIDWEALEREIFAGADSSERRRDRERAEEFKRAADRIASLILYSDMPRIDIEIRIREFRSEVLAVFSGKAELFDALYVARFRRLWKQFRDSEEELCGE